MKILLVDDEEIVLKGLQYLVTEIDSDFDIKIAQNGKIALQIMEQFMPDIIVTDIRMPIMDGLTLCEHLHDSGNKCKTIIISGYADFEYAKKSYRTRCSQLCAQACSTG